MANVRSFWRCAFGMALVAVVVAVDADGQDPNLYERFLIPASVGGIPGAYGTVWATELWYRNNSDFPVAVFPLAVSDNVPTMRRTVMLPIGYSPAGAPGRFLFVSRSGADDVQFDLRLFNLSDPAATWGARIPVVREGEFHETVNLINVPTGTEFRSALRIYGLPDGSAGSDAVYVRIYSLDERLLAESVLSLEGSPRYASILSVADAFPEIREVERVRILVTSRSGLSKIWAFVSVVSNSTQHVAVVAPD